MQTDVQRRAQLILQRRLNNTDIADLTNCSRATVRTWRQRLDELGATEDDVAELDELELRQLITPDFFARTHTFNEPDWERILYESVNRGVQVKTLFNEYLEQAPENARLMSMTTFYRTLKSHASKNNVTISFEYEPGEMIQADFVGRKTAKQPILLDEDGNERNYEIFCAISAKSQKIYVLVIVSQAKLPVMQAFISMLEYFGGSPVLIVIDNFKAAVAKTRRNGKPAELTPEFQELSDHYQFGLKPTRARKPKDKALVENAVRIVQNDILAPLRDRRFFTLAELNAAVSDRLSVLNDRPLTKGSGESRNQAFEQIDAVGYRPLPERRYEHGQWFIRVRVGKDYHVHVQGNRYSVPAKLANVQVNVKLTTTSVHIFHQGRAIATHIRDEGTGKQITNPDHMPEAHRHVSQERLSGIRAMVREIGPNAERLVDQHFRSNKNPKATAKMAIRLRAAAAEYPCSRVDAACLRALEVEKSRISTVENILAAGLDQLHPPADSPMHLPSPEENIRGAEYFASLLSQRKEEGDV